MAKTKPQDRKKRGGKLGKRSHHLNDTSQKPKASPETLLLQATAFLQTSQPEEALGCARQALTLLQPSGEPTVRALPALNILGEINVELGDIDAARENFLVAASLDLEGTSGDGPEKFLWLAQLNKDGGTESVKWFEKGIAILRREIGELEAKGAMAHILQELQEKKTKLAGALCGIAEVYMTDLSWEEDAEARCEANVIDAMLIAPSSPEPLQTLASVRISQLRIDDARAALTRSMGLWKDLDLDDAKVPDFSTRISLSRLLMEAEMEDDAIEVLERLVGENDGSLEAWYLGGWCLHLMSEKQKLLPESAAQGKKVVSLMRVSREWLQNSLNLYEVLEYEDERLKEHAEELVKGLNQALGPVLEDDEEEWEDADSEDEEMEGT